MNSNRRNFLKTLGLFTILPGAGRRWIKTSENLVVPSLDIFVGYNLIIEPSMYQYLLKNSDGPRPFKFDVGDQVRIEFSKTETEGIISWKKELSS